MYTSYDDLPLALTPKQAASILNIGKNNMYELLRSGAVHSVRVGGQYRIPKEAIKQLLSQ
ncbi:MAG: helix-turn-helix domain-containing protein [Butyricicoccus sp.]|nr:helix-turn-helix domain-containing protein [Butyricicoccus sp.]MCM1236164.1 helix-turn-helix domain-containing protein [Ruminococcus flavefaciens]